MDTQEYQSFIDREVQGAEKAISTMLLYYISALQATGVDDVKQYIATRISEMISLSEEQYKFVLANFEKDGKIIDNLNNCVQLLKNMEEKKELDLESIGIIKQVLELIIKDYKEAIEIK